MDGTVIAIIDKEALSSIKDRAIQHFHDDPGGADMLHRCLFRALADFLEHNGIKAPFEVRV